MSKHYASRYIVNVNIDKTFIQLEDANRGMYYIDRANTPTVDQFKLWFKNHFLKGMQRLTVFEYNKEEHDGQIDLIITKFCNLPNEIIEPNV